MRRLITIFYMIQCSTNSFSQAPGIEWQNTIGGDLSDQLTICQTIDSGFIVGGSSQSGIIGDKTDTLYGGTDYWIIKLNYFGNIQWQKSFGGSSNDDLYDLTQTSDKGYLLAGSSLSGISGNKTEETVAGSFDFWIIKLDSTGSIQWQNDIGGSGSDLLYSVEQAPDGGYILGGWSNSPISGDKTEANISGSEDYWIVKIDSLGNIEWQNDIGGTGQDFLYCIQVCTEGGYITCGKSSSSISGDKTEMSFGSEDYWFIRLDSMGEILWQKTIGGGQLDRPYNILQTVSNGYIVGGFSNSPISGNKTEPTQGDYDYWVVQLDSLGNIQWQNDIGGNLSDVLTDIHQTADEGFMVGGYSSSDISGDKTEVNIGFADYWIIKLDNIGNILWQKTFGGWSDDNLTTCSNTVDSGQILGGTSLSPASGDKTEDNNGSQDFWIIKLFPDTCEKTAFYLDTDNDGFGNSDDSIFACFAPFGYVANQGDCNDTIGEINPTAIEICNVIDDNCDGGIDEGLLLSVFYADNDNDGYGNSLIDTTTCLTEIANYVSDSSDCDDSNNLIHAMITYYADADSDSYGDVFNPAAFCNTFAPPGYVTDSTDCDDTNSDINPGISEILNGLDDNCNDSIDEGITSIYNLTIPDFRIYPNPNNGFFIIKLMHVDQPYILIKIYDITGRMVMHTELLYGLKQKLSPQTLEPGIYFLEISLGADKRVLKLLKNNH